MADLTRTGVPLARRTRSARQILLLLVQVFFLARVAQSQGTARDSVFLVGQCYAKHGASFIACEEMRGEGQEQRHN